MGGCDLSGVVCHRDADAAKAEIASRTGSTTSTSSENSLSDVPAAKLFQAYFASDNPDDAASIKAEIVRRGAAGIDFSSLPRDLLQQIADSTDLPPEISNAASKVLSSGSNALDLDMSGMSGLDLFTTYFESRSPDVKRAAFEEINRRDPSQIDFTDLTNDQLNRVVGNNAFSPEIRSAAKEELASRRSGSNGGSTGSTGSTDRTSPSTSPSNLEAASVPNLILAYSAPSTSEADKSKIVDILNGRGLEGINVKALGVDQLTVLESMTGLDKPIADAAKAERSSRSEGASTSYGSMSTGVLIDRLANPASAAEKSVIVAELTKRGNDGSIVYSALTPTQLQTLAVSPDLPASVTKAASDALAKSGGSIDLKAMTPLQLVTAFTAPNASPENKAKIVDALNAKGKDGIDFKSMSVDQLGVLESMKGLDQPIVDAAKAERLSRSSGSETTYSSMTTPDLLSRLTAPASTAEKTAVVAELTKRGGEGKINYNALSDSQLQTLAGSADLPASVTQPAAEMLKDRGVAPDFKTMSVAQLVNAFLSPDTSAADKDKIKDILNGKGKEGIDFKSLTVDQLSALESMPGLNAGIADAAKAERTSRSSGAPDNYATLTTGQLLDRVASPASADDRSRAVETLKGRADAGQINYGSLTDGQLQTIARNSDLLPQSMVDGARSEMRTRGVDAGELPRFKSMSPGQLIDRMYTATPGEKQDIISALNSRGPGAINFKELTTTQLGLLASTPGISEAVKSAASDELSTRSTTESTPSKYADMSATALVSRLADTSSKAEFDAVLAEINKRGSSFDVGSLYNGQLAYLGWEVGAGLSSEVQKAVRDQHKANNDSLPSVTDADISALSTRQQADLLYATQRPEYQDKAVMLLNAKPVDKSALADASNEVLRMMASDTRLTPGLRDVAKQALADRGISLDRS